MKPPWEEHACEEFKDIPFSSLSPTAAYECVECFAQFDEDHNLVAEALKDK